jgi:hypothetical protein
VSGVTGVGGEARRAGQLAGASCRAAPLFNHEMENNNDQRTLDLHRQTANQIKMREAEGREALTIVFESCGWCWGWGAGWGWGWGWDFSQAG